MNKTELIKTNAIVLTATLLFMGTGHVMAAELDDHSKYRIVSYSFNGDTDSSTADSFHFGPLLITGATSDVLDYGLYGYSDFGISNPTAVTDTIALSANISATPDLYLHGSIGMTANRWDASKDHNYKSSWEANLGVIYKLFNNIRYELHFGYMDTGDLFKESSSYSDVESIIMISNKLTMSF